MNLLFSLKRCGMLLAALVLAGSANAADEAPVALRIHPGKIEVAPNRFPSRFIVSALYADGSIADVTDTADVKVLNTELGEVDSSRRFIGLSSGTTQLVASLGGLSTYVDVQIGDDKPWDPDFGTSVVASLTRAGCSQGACHGSPKGKNGFRLSLRGFDAKLDFSTLVQEEYGRRLNRVAPENSLILEKGSAKVAHQGGKRLSEDDYAYQLLKQWVTMGHKDSSSARTVVDYEIYPNGGRLHKSSPTHRMVVFARFNDGTVEDVTDLCVFATGDNAPADVSKDGTVQFHNTAESPVLIHYKDQVTSVRFTYIDRDDEFKYESPKARNFVDEQVFAKQAELQLKPGQIADDSVFLRRVYLDLTGGIPDYETARAFIESDDPMKRQNLIDSLLDSSEYASFWALKWADIMRANRETVSTRGVHNFHRYLIRIFDEDRSFDDVAREIVTSKGNTINYPEANFFRIARNPTDAAEAFSQLFLGVRIQCAKCHNHPYEAITQKDYYALSANFSRMSIKGTRFGIDDEIVLVNDTGDVKMPGNDEPLDPMAFGVVTSTHDSVSDHRTGLAEWIADPENKYFARSTVNRIWLHLMGQGIVEPVDDFRDSNPPSNAGLLDALAEEFIESGYRFKPVIRAIANSSSYQLRGDKDLRQSTAAAEPARYFVAPVIRLLSAEQIIDSISIATDIPEVFEGYPEGTRAIELAEGDVPHQFLKAFTRPIRDVACDCARDTEPTLNQVLHLVNNPDILNKIESDESRLGRWITAELDDNVIVENLYLGTLSRKPTSSELGVAESYIKDSGNRIEALQDLQHALLNSNEFLLRH